MSAPIPLSAFPSHLSEPEQSRLTDCEAKIERGISVFLEVGNALLEIRDSRLYRQQFATFETYCKERWGFARNYANKVIAATEVVANLGTNVPITPTTESQARPLTALEPEVQREVWREVIETTPRLNPFFIRAMIQTPAKPRGRRMNSVEAKRLLESVQDNHSALAACFRHSFVATDERPIFKKYRCERCGGTVDVHAKLWYETGLAHSSHPNKE